MTRLSLSSLIVIFFLGLFPAAAVHAEDPQNVLVIHSYDAGYEWTRDFHRGIELALDSSTSAVKLSVEYLDTKRIISEDYFAELNRYFAAKYANYRFDGVLLTDDNALRFFNQLDLPNLKQLPTVAGGIGDLTASLLPSTDFGTILYEKDYVAENLALIHKLKPDMQRLYYLADYSYSSILLREWLLIELRQQYPDTELVEIRDIPLEQTRQQLARISPDDAVLLTHFNTELDNAVYHGYSHVAKTLSAASRAPVFVLWGFYLKGDVVGGYVNRSQDIGIKLVQILGSQMSHLIKVNAIVGEYTPATFQYHALNKFGISEDELPENAQILDKPESFLDQHREVLVVFLGVSLFLILIIIVLGALLQRKRELHKRDQKIVALQKQTLDVQKNLIHVLGESIETRSGETGNHVNRVAKLSAHLAGLYGLPARDCEIMEIISPMHDVGKIGIPEAILNKPGKLSADEWSLMQTHARVGYDLLHVGEESDFMNLAAMVSLQHHERWDGQGYPDGVAGDDIHIFARITAVADVFDALRSKRCYKDAWSIEQVVNYFRENSGTQFDPALVQLFLDNIDEFVAIRRAYPD